ncbi:MAG: thiol-disulfide isomerase [Nitrospirales bacterium]|nr:MAG: thiol-disulfide isomerase [Nitrospirales bacterium]
MLMNAHTLSDVSVDTWVQGGPITLEELVGSVIVIEVFQVNCPGCFLYALPKAIQLHERYRDKGLVIIGLATAFEDYDKNTIENLQRLVDTGEVIGETLKALTHQGMLTDGKLEWRLPFPVGMDRVVPESEPVTHEKVERYAQDILPNFGELTEDQQLNVLTQVRNYLKQKTMKAETFDRFSLQGTPSAILFDRKGQLRDVSFGQMEHQQSLVEQCLAEAR